MKLKTSNEMYQKKSTGILSDYIISSNGYKSPLSFENALKKNY